MLEFFLTLCLTFVTIFASLFFLSKRLLLNCFFIMTLLSVFALILNLFEQQMLLFIGYKEIYCRICELLDTILWLMFVGLMTAGSRGEYRDKQHLEIENQVDSTPENSFANLVDRLNWDFEDEYIEYMDWPGYTDDYFKSDLKKERDKTSYKERYY
jgi:hypothetical protein